jgi:predicted Zn-dependent protease
MAWVLAPLWIGGIAAASAWGPELLGELASQTMPAAVERWMGKAIEPMLKRQALLPAQARTWKKREELSNRVKQLANAADISGVKLHFVAGGMNAFAAPGGHIAFMEEMLLTLDIDELTAVAAHEVAHLKHRHTVRTVAQVMSVKLLTQLVLGGSATADVAQGMIEKYEVLAYRRDAEREADATAIALLRQTGYSPALLAQAFAKMQALQRDGLPTWASSHPSTQERIEAASRAAKN